jgi:biopolymer transport protein ExbD
MKFPRNAKIFRGQLDAAPFAGVFFVLVIFVALSSNIIYTPGISVNLPQGSDLPGTDKPTVIVAVDANGQFYFRNQIIHKDALRNNLREAVQNSTEPLTLVMQADKDVKSEVLEQLCLIAEEVGIKAALWATRPPPFSSVPRRQP